MKIKLHVRATGGDEKPDIHPQLGNIPAMTITNSVGLRMLVINLD